MTRKHIPRPCRHRILWWTYARHDWVVVTPVLVIRTDASGLRVYRPRPQQGDHAVHGVRCTKCRTLDLQRADMPAVRMTWWPHEWMQGGGPTLVVISRQDAMSAVRAYINEARARV